ncbi:MAG: chromate transporter, partial [Erysipelotrichaceae bacterium]
FMKHLLSGLRPCVVALIATAGLSILILALYGVDGFPKNIFNIDLSAVVLFIISLFLLRKYKLNPIMIMAITGVAGVVVSFM